MRAFKISLLVFILSISVSAQDFWHKISGSLGNVDVTDLCLTKSEFLLAYIHWDGLYYTTNNGEQWIRTNYQGNEPYTIESINDSIIVVGRPDGYVLVSNDTGRTWNVTGNFTALSLYYESSTQIIYMGTNRYNSSGICGIYVSSDYGQSWSLLYEFPYAGSIQSAFELYVTKTNQVILVSQGNAWPPWSKIYYLYQSTDQGQSWETIYENQDSPVTHIVEDISANLFALAYTKLLVSEDEGNTWINRVIPDPYSFVLVTDFQGEYTAGGFIQLIKELSGVKYLILVFQVIVMIWL